VGQVQQATFYNQPDEIVWCWTTDGIYSMKSAYSIQCSVSFSRFDGKSIWKAHAEGKQKFFAWLLVQTSRQTCCVIRSKALATHLCLQCTFTKEVWFLVRSWKGVAVQVPADNASVGDWWQPAQIAAKKKGGIWKEINRRVSDGRFQQPVQVLQLIKKEVDLCRQAC
jgi:hypothetical protein